MTGEPVAARDPAPTPTVPDKGVFSLKLRLIGGAAVWVSAALAISWLVLVELFTFYIEDLSSDQLRSHLDTLIGSLEVDADGNILVSERFDAPAFERPFSGQYWQVSAEGVALLRSRSLWDETLDLPPPPPIEGALFRYTLPGPFFGRPAFLMERVLTVADTDISLRVSVMAETQLVQGVVRPFSQTLALSLALLAIGLIVAVYIQVALGLKPLEHMRAGLARIRSGEARGIGGKHPREVMPLVNDLNALLSYNEEVIDRARTQAGNLAHALKTPLTVLNNESDRLRSAGETELADTLKRQVEEMRHHIDHHLKRARAAAAVSTPGRATPLKPLLGPMVRVMEKLSPDREIAFIQNVPAAAVFAGEVQDLQEILGNLLENAVKFARTTIRISARIEGRRLILSVADDGPGVPEDKRAEVLERGKRLDESKPGSGLGLSIVKDLAQLYGGAVSLKASDLGGLEAVLDLPAADITGNAQAPE